MGDYTISYSKSGYLDESQDVPLETDGQTLEVATMRMLSSSCASTGTISGRISDSVSIDNVSSVYVYIKRGYNSSIYRRTKASGYTDSSGGYSFNDMKRGWYTARTYKSGYMSG